jgi:hypothetical protein
MTANDARQFYEEAYPTPITLGTIGTAKPLFPAVPSQYWTDIKIQIITMGTQSSLYLGDQNQQTDLIGSQAGQYYVLTAQPGHVINVARLWITGTNGSNDASVTISGLDPQITFDQVINPFTRV